MADLLKDGPEFSPEELTGQTLIDVIETSGAAVIRNCLDGARVRAMLARAEFIYQQKECEYRRGELNPTQRTLFEFGNVSQGALDRPDDRFSVIRFALKAGLQSLLSDLWGGRIVFLPRHCIPRRQMPRSKINGAVPFHQDASFLETTSLVLNFWIPLVPCGVRAPGLEVVLGNPRELLSSTLHGPISKDYREIALSEDRIVSQWGREKLWHPALEQGDVFVFSNLTIHRTYMTPEMTESRISLEVRCSDADNAALRGVQKDLIEVRFDQTAVA